MHLQFLNKVLLIFMLLIVQACNSKTSDNNANKSNESEKNTANNFLTSMREKQMDAYLQQASLAQLHRWYQFYEHPQANIENQLDILSKDVIVNSSLGTARGHTEYAAAVRAIPSQWKNAHFVKQSDIKVKNTENIEMQTTITYLNQGRSPNNEISQSTIGYDMHLRTTQDLLPKFTKIDIKPMQGNTTETFIDAYAENRLKSLMYYWLAIVEHPDRRSEPAHEILSQDFSLNFSSNKIKDLDALSEWFAGPASSVAFTTHKPEKFSYQKLSDNNYTLSVEFAWNGILPNTKAMTARTKHTWQVIDNPQDRFAKIKNIDVEILVPFSVVN